MKCPKCYVKISYSELDRKDVQADGKFACDACDSVLKYVEDELCEVGFEGVIVPVYK